MKIAIVKLSALGDIVHAMVVLQYIKQAIPDSRIDWIVEESFTSVLEYNPHISNILPVRLKSLKKNKLSFFKEFDKVKKYAKNEYDIVIDMQGLLKSAIVSKILGASVGFDKNSIREKIASLFYGKSFFVPYAENIILRNMSLVSQSLSIDNKENSFIDKEAFLYFSKDALEKTASYLQKGQNTIVHILGSSWESKVYPKEKFVEIIDALDGNHLLVWGNSKEKQSARYIAKHTQAQALPAMDLNELKALISKADLVIGGDSGPTHFAWALNRPSITVFGPTPSQRNVLQTDINKIVDCNKEINPLKFDKNNLCINSIDSKCVVKLAKELFI